MDDFDKDQVLQWYGWLEDELLEVFKYMPPAGQNLSTFSPRLATLIIESCGLLDSVLRQVSPNPSMVNGKNVARGDLTITHYATLYAAKHDLPNTKSILLITPPRYLVPFNEWDQLLAGGQYRPAPWWRIHTELKHDRIANLRKATLDIAIQSLCALHLMVASLPDFARAVLRRGWIPGQKFSPELTIDLLEGRDRAQSLVVLVESKLFVVARGREKFPDIIEDFQPGLLQGSERLIDFFGRKS